MAGCLLRMPRIIVFSLLLIAGLLACINCQLPLIIRQEEAKGSEAVLLTLATIQQSGLFGNDNDLLRRIAYVETRDGTLPDTFRDGYHGGIWAVHEAVFLRTQDTAVNSRLSTKISQIRRLGVIWLSVKWRDLRKPLYSAIAAQLVLFIASSAVPSASNLEAQAIFWKQNFNSSVGTSEFVSLSGGLEGNVLESSANEFFVGFAFNIEDRIQFLYLFVSTPEPQPVSFVVTANGFSFTGVATSNSSTRVDIPTFLEVTSIDDREKGIRIKAEGNKNLVVYGLSYQQFTSDAFLALPCSNFGVDEYEYYAVTYTPISSLRSFILVVACEDNTVITSPEMSFTLNRQQTYQIESSTDLTGTKIVSSKPIALFGAAECVNVPIGAGSCDHLTEQIPPTATWGSKFLIASLLGRNSGETFRIISSEGATVTVNCSGSATPAIYSLPNPGSWTEFTIAPNAYCSVEASSPVYCAQFSHGASTDGLLGDPFTMMIPPIEQYSNNYIFEVLEEFANNFITICGSHRTICGYITRVSISSGEHRLFHQDSSAQVGVSAYGFNAANSYGYPGGLRLIPVQLATVSFSSPTYTVVEGKNLQVTITRSGATDTMVVTLLAADIFQGTAFAERDYKVEPVIVKFEEGVTEKQVTIVIEEDSRVELAENFELYLTGGAGVHLSPFSRAEVTITDNDGMITLEPAFGSMLGGTGVLVTLESNEGSHKNKEDDSILCIFDGVEVKGVFISEERTLCVSPQLSRTGRVTFQFKVRKFIAESVYTSLSFMNSFEVYVANEELTFSSETMVNVQWSPLSIFPMESPATYTVDIDLLELNEESGVWEKLLTLGSDLINNGSAGVRIPNLENLTSDEISPVIISISISEASTSGSLDRSKRGVVSSILQRLGRFALKTFKNTPVRFLMKLIRQATQRLACEVWSAFEPPNIGEEISTRLPRCPTRVRDVRAPSSGYKEEKLSAIVSVVGAIQDYFGTTVIDDSFRLFFHPDTESCHRQRVSPSSSQTGGSGQQCCYDSSGSLIVGSPGGGTVDRISPDVDIVGHLLVDVVPYLLCCKAGIFSDCDEYYRNRPSDQGIDYSPTPPPAIMFGDPHIITLDGLKYTFNGKGEFILIEMDDQSFTLQGRMVPISPSNGADPVGTVFSAIAAKQLFSSLVQFEILNNQIIIFVDGDQIDFSVVTEQEFDNVTVTFLGNATYSATFANGAYVEVKEENQIFSVLIVSLPAVFMEKNTRGLMGSFNGDAQDDLLPRLGQDPLPHTSGLQEIHNQFGLTWIIDIPSESLFTYHSEQNWNSYYDPFFLPSYEPVFSDPNLELEAASICGGDIFCLFDIAATGRTDIGLSTLIGNENYEEIVDLQIPVVCSMPCVNGACVANDTCNCAAGYSGSTCNETVVGECEENPCQNGGTCTRHVLSFLCDCPPNFIGDLCECSLDYGGDLCERVFVNDSVISNPQMTVPLYTNDVPEVLPSSDDNLLNLCFEVHGRANTFLNLVSDDCVSVNAHYQQILPSENVNIIDKIAFRTVDNNGTCQNIEVGLDECTPKVGGVEISDRYSSGGISLRRYSNRVRVSLPNCRPTAGLVMWVFCEKQEFFSRTRVNSDGTAVVFEGDALRFVISRGLNLQDSSHGILGQFWNVPISMEPYTGPFNIEPTKDQSVYVVTVQYPGKEPRHFIGYLNFPSWESKRGLHCLFAGNAQAGNVFEVPRSRMNGPVIEGRFSNYIISSPFGTDFRYSHFDSSRCF